MRFGSSNVVYRKILRTELEDGTYEVATYKGVAKKTIFFLIMTLVGAFGGIGIGMVAPEIYAIMLAGSGLLTLVFALISFFSVKACKVTGSLYCISEGCLIGFISMMAAALAGGAVTIALLSTVAVFSVVSLLFVTNVVKVNKKFMKFLLIFAIGFLVSQLIFWIVASVAKIEVSVGIVLIIGVITVFLATLYLFFDLEHIRQIVEGQYPKEFEWFTAFGLAFTLLWLYVEILRIIIILFNSRN